MGNGPCQASLRDAGTVVVVWTPGVETPGYRRTTATRSKMPGVDTPGRRTTATAVKSNMQGVDTPGRRTTATRSNRKSPESSYSQKDTLESSVAPNVRIEATFTSVFAP